MPDPALDPDTDLLDTPQDGAVRQSHVRLGTFLGLMRILCGPRGHAWIGWHRGGFTYTVQVIRDRTATPLELDIDTTIRDLETVRSRVIAALDG